MDSAGDESVDLTQVVGEIEDEVAARRASGDLPADRERELDQLFVAQSPAGSDTALVEALEEVDRTMFVDPVVPVESTRPAGRAAKKGMRSLSLWYVSWLTRQVNQFAVASSRSLHIIEQRLSAIDRQISTEHDHPSTVVEFPGLSGTDAWWAAEVVGAVSGSTGRVLHAAAGADHWLVKEIRSAGVTADGFDPRFGHGGGVADHLALMAPGELGAVILSGVIEGLDARERSRLLESISGCLAPDGVLIIHSVTPATWFSPEAPAAADLAPGRALWPDTWHALLEASGFGTSVRRGPSDADYLVTAVRRQS